MEHGPNLGFPFSSRRVSILLLGGSKKGDENWYEVHVPVADRLFQKHLEAIKEEG